MATMPPATDNHPWRKRFKERAVRAMAVLRERRMGLSSSGMIIIGGFGAGVALWPLARAAWDLLGLTNGQAWRLVFLGACTLVLGAGVVGANWKRISPVRLVWLILTAWLVAAGAVAALTALAWLVLGAPAWQQLEGLTPRHLDAITTRAFAIVAGLGGVALLVIAYRRQRTSENGEQREATKLFNERFTTAYTELGSEHAAVRLGAIHALAHLADDAPSEEEVQMVIDVLCAYLRMPYAPAPGDLPEDAAKEEVTEHRERELEFASLRQVRHTVIRIIGNHLREPTRWRGKDYDFTGTVFDGGNLTGAHFTGGTVSFAGVEFSDGAVDFGGVTFSGGKVDFTGVNFSDGKVDFSEATFTGGTVFFAGAEFSDGVVDFGGVTFSSGKVDFTGVNFSDGKVDFSEATFSGGTVSFIGAKFSGAKVGFIRAKFSGGTVSFFGAKFSGAEVDFFGAAFLGGEVSFIGVDFSGGVVGFSGVEFSGGTVSFTGARFTDGTVDFQGASGRCPVNLLAAVKSGEPGAVPLPVQWHPNLIKDGEEVGLESPSDVPEH